MRWKVAGSENEKGTEGIEDSQRKETKRGSINHQHENMGIMDNGEHSGYRMTNTMSTIA